MQRYKSIKYERYKRITELTVSTSLKFGPGSTLPNENPIVPERQQISAPMQSKQRVSVLPQDTGGPVDKGELVKYKDGWKGFAPPERPEPADKEIWGDRAETFWDKVNKVSIPKTVDVGKKVIDKEIDLTVPKEKQDTSELEDNCKIIRYKRIFENEEPVETENINNVNNEENKEPINENPEQLVQPTVIKKVIRRPSLQYRGKTGDEVFITKILKGDGLEYKLVNVNNKKIIDLSFKTKDTAKRYAIKGGMILV